MSLVEGILLALVAFAPWLEGGATPEGLAALHAGVLALAAAALWRARARGRLRLQAGWPALCLLLFTAWGGISLVGASYRFGAFDTWWDQCVATLLVLALSTLRPGQRYRAALPVLVALLGAAQAVPAVITRLTEGAAFSPSFLNPNHLSAWLNVSLLVALHGAGWLGGGEDGRGRRPGRAFWIPCGLACLAGTLAVGSRGGLLSLLAVLGAVALRERVPWPRLSRRLAALALLVAAAGALSVGLRFGLHDDPYRHDRPRLWMTALRSWAEAPVMGHGPGMYDHVAPARNFPQERAVFRFSKQPRSAHSQPLQVLAEEGLVGLVLLLLVAGSAFAALAGARRAGGRDAGWARCVLLSAAVVGLHALVEMPFSPPAMILTLVAMAWPALAPAGPGSAAAGVVLAWPRRGQGRAATDLMAAAALASILGVAVAGPYLSFAAARYAEAPGRSPVRIDLAFRLAERFNPWSPFPGYRRARAALARVPSISPALLANAAESLERTVRLAPADPSAHALLASLYRRAALDLPGAGPGAVDAAGRHHDRALELAPLDARLWIDRATFDLMTGRPDRALADAESALALEPRSLTAAHVRLEALVALERTGEAREALAELDALRERMEGYRPLNGYEASLLRLDAGRVEGIRRSLGGSVPVPPA